MTFDAGAYLERIGYIGSTSPTTETLRGPVGLGTRPEMGLALQLVRRGYVTLSPEC